MPKKGQLSASATADSKRQRAYNSQPAQKKRRAERNASRTEVAKKVGRAAIAGKDIDHRDHNTSNKSSKNLSIMSVSKNRAANQYDKRKRK